MPSDPSRFRRIGAIAVLAALLALVLGALFLGVSPLDPRRVARKAVHEVEKLAARRTKWVAEREEPSVPQPSSAELGFAVFQRSTLARIGQHAQPAGAPWPRIRLQAAWNQHECAQIAVHALRDLHGAEIHASALDDGRGHSIPADAVDVRMERYYALRLSVKGPARLGVVPKTLEPEAPIDIPDGTTRPYWITVKVPSGVPGGTYRGTLTVGDQAAHADVQIEVEVLPRELDEATAMLGPWAVPVLRSYGRVQHGESDRTLTRADLVLGDIREHGMTTVGLWSGTVWRRDDDQKLTIPDLDAALDLYHRHGFPQPMFYAPVNLLSTNKLRTSENYRKFDPSIHVDLASDIAREYTPRAAAAGIPGIIFAPVEEPNLADGIALTDAPDTRQNIATDLLAAMKSAGAKTAMTCTPDSAKAGEGKLDYWLVAYKKFAPSVWKEAERNGGRVGLYANATLMGNGTYFSRFFFGYYPWARDLAAMMAWTYPLLPKRFPQNLDAGKAEGAGNVAEGFLGSDGKPVPVIQWELAREGVDDFRYLVTLAHLVDAAQGARRPRVRRVARRATDFLAGVRGSVEADPHHYAFEDPQSFEPVAARDWDEARFEKVRSESFELTRALSHLLERRRHHS